MNELNKENFKQFLEQCRKQEELLCTEESAGYCYESAYVITIRELYFLAKEWFGIDLTEDIKGQSGYEI